MYYLIIAILGLFIGAGNAAMDIVEKQYNQSKFSLIKKLQHWFNPELSWKNKWKNGNRSEGERFWGSSTVFVMITDFWHFAKTFIIMCILIIIAISAKVEMNKLLLVSLIYAEYVIAFELFFNIILRQKSMWYSKFLKKIIAGFNVVKTFVAKRELGILTIAIILAGVFVLIRAYTGIVVFGYIAGVAASVAGVILLIMIVYAFVINPIRTATANRKEKQEN